MHSSRIGEEVARLVAIVDGDERRPWLEREQAVKGLVALGEPAVVPLVRALDWGTYGPSGMLLRVFGQLCDPSAVPGLCGALHQTDPHVRQEAAKALGSIGDPRAIGPLIDAIRVESGDIEDITAWQDAAFALAQIGEPALMPLISALADADYKVRAESAVALGQLGDRRAVQPLLAALADIAVQVRLDTAEALGRLGDATAVDALAARLSDADEHVRTYVVRALGDLISGQLFPPLIAALDDPATDVRCEALRALARSAGQLALDLVLAHVNDADGCVRNAAVRMLGRVGDASLLPVLERIEREDPGRCWATQVKDTARYAQECIQRRLAGDPIWWKSR